MANQPTIGRLRFLIRELLQKLWVRVTSFAVLGLATALAAFALRPFIPDTWAGIVGADAIVPILQIIASSMLTVTTFSLSILTAAYATASSGSTPRAVQLLVSDGVSQTVLATFIGAFVFSLVGLILLQTELYGDGGRVVLFAVTLIVILIVVVSLLRWINRLGELGLVGDNLSRVEQAADDALAARLASPWLGGNPLRGPPPADSVPIMSPQVGHVQNCDMQALSDLAEEAGILVYVTAQPGDLVHLACPLFHVSQIPSDPQVRDGLIACVTLRRTRSFDQDPRFGLSVLSEIGQRALSPAVNDPGTAQAVAICILRILSRWSDEAGPEVQFPRIYVPGLTVEQLLRDNLLPLARDGAAMVEVQRTLQGCLLALVQLAPQVFGKAAVDLSQDMLDHARKGLTLGMDVTTVVDLSAEVRHQAEKVVPSGPRGNPEMQKTSSFAE
ncbi:MAG: DUF2254 domain-containing protein [Paracoccus sp. (in: a-proteobacteria)]|uniref:DUF2254 domain-containing protein n=1 Tax=Paracoccus sp. TaxID=267 RepID=UPI002E856D20|nr:DUF2254 domain-containing protein [Pseudomonadota bacterium]